MIILRANAREHSSFFPLLFRLSAICFLCAAAAIVLMFSLFLQKSLESFSFDQNWPSKMEFRLLSSEKIESSKKELDIKKELRLIAMNTRPDAKDLEKLNGQPRIQVSFRGYSVPLALRSGQAVYFNREKASSSPESLNGPPAPLAIHALPASWKITPIALAEQIYVEVSSQEEKSEFLLQKDSNGSLPFYDRAKNSEWFQKITTARYWMDDCLGSNTVTPKIGMGNHEKVLPVSKGDYLFYASGAWQKGGLEFAKGRPLAKIIAATPSGVEALVWDETGFFKEIVSLKFLNLAPYSFVQLDSLFASLKQRNATEVSCIMGKRRVVLKPGTWWIKSAKGWKRLKTRLEMEDYLSYRLLGELIIIEGLESFQGKGVIKGRQIDPLRTSEQPFSMSVPESLGRMKSSLPSASRTEETRSGRSIPQLLKRQREVRSP
jgi:hypothetical protein